MLTRNVPLWPLAWLPGVCGSPAGAHPAAPPRLCRERRSPPLAPPAGPSAPCPAGAAPPPAPPAPAAEPRTPRATHTDPERRITSHESFMKMKGSEGSEGGQRGRRGHRSYLPQSVSLSGLAALSAV